MTLILNNEEVAAAVSMRDCIEALEDGFREHAHGRAINQIRYVLMYCYTNDRNITRATNSKP